MSESLLQIEHVEKSYHAGQTDLEVLKDVTFRVAAGEVIALMGPSGVGKTTLLNIIGALDKPDSGEVLLSGVAISSLTSSELAKVRNASLGFVFQFHHLLPEFNAIENVIIPGLIQGKISKTKRNYAENLMETFGISGRTEHYPHELSGGEKQRVALARALINKPALVLADEPTGNLDRRTGARLLDAILKFSKEHNQSFVIATHDDDIAKQADRILLLDNGIILETEQLKEGIH